MELIKKLKLIGSIHTNSWEIYSLLWNRLKEGNLKWITAKYNQNFFTKEKGDIDEGLTKFKSRDFSTGSKGIDIKLSKGLIITIRNFETDNFDGHRKNLNWEGSFKISNDLVHLFSEYIDSSFGRYCEDLWYIQEEERKQKEIETIAHNLLK